MKILLLSLLGFAATACQPSLDHQPRTKPFSVSAQFADESSARPQVSGTIAFNRAPAAPPLVNKELLKTGRAKYEINCAVCHGYTGEGNGIVTQRGYPALKTYVAEGVLKKSNVDLYNTISNGKHQMPAFGAKLNPQEIWSVIHYVRVLKLRSQMPAELLSAVDRQRLKEGRE